jgi:L-ascorbate metabolism protein UlaG (beta-lactamase superfamily)
VRIRRLGWAGLELEAGDQLAVVDLLQDTDWISGFVGEPRTALPGPSRPADLALVTHLHADHADPASLKAALKPGAPVLRPAPAGGDGLENAALELAEAGLRELDTRVVEPWETVEAGPFRISAIPAADGTGDPQVSWVVADDETTLIHCGDTLFHGWWWRAAMRFGPIDLAFMPVNGVLTDFPHRQPSTGLPAAMTPREAAAAARALRVSEAIPIHYETFHSPPLYDAPDGTAQEFLEEAKAAGVRARMVEPGELVG